MSDEALRDLYAGSYFEGGEYLDYEREAPALRRNFRPRIRELRGLVPGGGRLWEVGCAYGFFLEAAQEYFEVGGCDISEHAIDRARQRVEGKVHCVDYLNWTAPEPFDVVCLWDTVEHLQAPERYLERAYRDLADGGVLALSTGDIGAWTARIRGAKWRLIHPPTHLHYFSAASMKVLLTRLGFRDIRIRHCPFWRSADAVAFRLLAHPPGRTMAPVYRTLQSHGVLGFSFPLQTFDLMTVTARK